MPLRRNIPTGVGKRLTSRCSMPPPSEHPHRRGEKARGGPSMTSRAGTSPQAWGKGRINLPADRRTRNIPTGVGKSRSRLRALASNTEHPHRRGEKRPSLSVWRIQGGTSPQAWGKVNELVDPFLQFRNIPTGVGKSLSKSLATAMLTEHPHRRGEKGFSPSPRVFVSGTSPQAWGKDTQECTDSQPGRNIPTGVGKRDFGNALQRRLLEHPHRRGEKVI